MKNNAAILNQLQSRLFRARPVADWTILAPTVRSVRGREPVAALCGMLVELSQRTGQGGAMDWLDHFVRSPDSVQKIPYVLLVGRSSGADFVRDPFLVSAEDVRGAVLLYEYAVAGRGTKVFATDDMIGVRTVIAAEEDRVEVAEIVLRNLMRMGAVVALISLDGDPGSALRTAEDTSVVSQKFIDQIRGRNAGPSTPFGAKARQTPLRMTVHLCSELLRHHTSPAYRMTMRTRTTPRYLALGKTLDETLSRLGKHTRRNLRYYRRKVESELGAEFVPRVEMGRQEFLQMNRDSTNPAPEDMVEWRYRLIEQTHAEGATMFAGLRAGDGRWLSLIGGRRHGQTTELDWQMNLAGLPHYSLCTVMRSYLLEQEIVLGMKKLVCQGGTPHPMRFAFSCAETTDILAVRRRSARAWLLRRFSRTIFPEKNFLAATLREMQRGTVEQPRSPVD